MGVVDVHRFWLYLELTDGLDVGPRRAELRMAPSP